MRNFMKKGIDSGFYDSSCFILPQIQKLTSLFKFGEQRSLNSIEKYIFESFEIRDRLT